MANFSPAEISTRLTGLKFCCDYMTASSFSRESKWRREIGPLLLLQFGLLAAINFQLFWMVTAYKKMELKRIPSLAAYLSGRKTYLQRKRRYLQARRVHGFLDSVVLLNLICSEVDVLIRYLSFEIRETVKKILSFITLIPLKSLLLPSGSHVVSCFSARAEIPFRLHEIFSNFLARLAGLKILARARIFSPGLIAPRAKSLSM